MYGFAPGFCYLGGLPAELAVSRRSTIRSPTPENVVLIGGGLSLVSTISMPTGWYVIGRTPERMYQPARETPFLVGVGDGPGVLVLLAVGVDEAVSVAVAVGVAVAGVPMSSRLWK